MRILEGRWAGTDLVSPSGRVRPTAEPVRARWMELVADELRGARVLELYAGTGALGLEALSRGALSVDFVENGPGALHALKANVARLRVREQTRIFRVDALDFTARLHVDAYDLCFADPPYTSRLADRLVHEWSERPFSRVLVVETGDEHTLPPGGRKHLLGDAALTVFRHEARPQPS